MRNYLDSPSVLMEFKKATSVLRERGFAITVFNPQELQGVDPKVVENQMVQAGNESIDVLTKRG